MTNDKIPSFIKNRIDLKQFSIQTSAIAWEKLIDHSSTDKKNKLIIVTTSASIIGELINPADVENEPSLLINSKALELRDGILYEKENSNNIIINNTSIIILKDVTVIPFANPETKTNFKFMNVFSDQILGYSFGDFS